MTPQFATMLLLGALTVAACSGGDNTAVDVPRPSSSTSASTSPTAPAPTVTPLLMPSASPTAALPAGVDVLIRATVAGGKVTTDQALVAVAKGKRVRLVVTSDVADEIHLHTYDKMVKVAAGATATLDFTATLSGTFEVELEKRELRLLRIRVR